MTLWDSNAIKRSVARWLRQGISPRQLALTLSLGFAIGCIPVVGVPTIICTALAIALRLNLPAIQAANYAAMPFQVALIVPFVRLGGWLFPFASRPAVTAAVLLRSPLAFLGHVGVLASQAILAWLLIAAPAVVLMTLTLTTLLQKMPRIATTASGAQTGPPSGD